jgi:hypothetical protein
VQLLFIQKVLYWKALSSLYLTTYFGLTGHLQVWLGKVAAVAAMRWTALASGFVSGWFISYGFVYGFAVCSCWVMTVLFCCSAIMTLWYICILYMKDTKINLTIPAVMHKCVSVSPLSIKMWQKLRFNATKGTSVKWHVIIVFIKWCFNSLDESYIYSYTITYYFLVSDHNWMNEWRTLLSYHAFFHPLSNKTITWRIRNFGLSTDKPTK